MPLDPYHLTPAASLNRLRIVDLSGLELPASVKGKTGYELVSAHALCEQIRTHSKALKLSEVDLAGDERSLPPLFDQCLESEDVEVQATAREIAVQFGRSLGYLLLTLKRGDTINRESRTDWDDSYWNHWNTIQTVYLGGGLLSGRMGRLIVDEVLPNFKLNHTLLPAITLADYKGLLPLVGAARYLPSDAEQGAVLDFGGSFVKRAYAVYDAGTLIKLHELAPVPAQWTGNAHPQELFDFMVTTIAETWQTHKDTAPMIPVSIASYITNGQPAERQGGAYAELHHLSLSLEYMLSEAVSQKLKTPINIRLLHDGSAAATTYPGALNSAVLMLGTAIGIGFPPPAKGLRPIVDRVKVTSHLY